MMETVTFETKCYENDWEFVLKTNYLDEMLRRCSFPFTHKQLIINNVSISHWFLNMQKRR